MKVIIIRHQLWNSHDHLTVHSTPRLMYVLAPHTPCHSSAQVWHGCDRGKVVTVCCIWGWLWMTTKEEHWPFVGACTPIVSAHTFFFFFFFFFFLAQTPMGGVEKYHFKEKNHPVLYFSGVPSHQLGADRVVMTTEQGGSPTSHPLQVLAPPSSAIPTTKMTASPMKIYDCHPNQI